MTWTPVVITSPYPDNNLPPGTIHLCNICGGGINYYPPTKVIITVGDMADEKAKGAVRLSLSTNLGKSWRELELPVPDQYRDGLAGPLSPIFSAAQMACCRCIFSSGPATVLMLTPTLTVC